MKTYCKRKDVSDVAFVKESISEFLLDRLDKSNVAKLFAYYNGISNTKSRKCINDSKEFVEGTIECIAADISENIRNRTVVDHILLVTPNEPLVKYVEIVDGLSGKKRELGIEKLIFQLYETIIRDATKEMFEAKIGEYQVASIKGRGQSYGKKHIKRWISSDPEGTKYCGKADVQKCYPSMPHDKLKALLHRDLRKSDMLLYLFDTIIYLYDYANELLGRNDCLGKGILIGSPVSKDLCNYYMSYLAINQVSATSKIHIPEGEVFTAVTKGIGTSISYEKDGRQTERFDTPDAENVIELNGIKSELVICND